MARPVLPRNGIKTLEPGEEPFHPVAHVLRLPGEVSVHPVVIVLGLRDGVAPEGDGGELGAEVEETDRVKGDKVVAGDGVDERLFGGYI